VISATDPPRAKSRPWRPTRSWSAFVRHAIPIEGDLIGFGGSVEIVAPVKETRS